MIGDAPPKRMRHRNMPRSHNAEPWTIARVNNSWVLLGIMWDTEKETLIGSFMGPTWAPPGAVRTQVGSMLATRTLLSGNACDGNIKLHSLKHNALDCLYYDCCKTFANIYIYISNSYIRITDLYMHMMWRLRDQTKTLMHWKYCCYNDKVAYRRTVALACV